MLSLLRILLQRFCLWLKHTVLDVAHPLPSKGITVFLGSIGSLQSAITRDVISSTDIPNLVVLTQHPDDPDDEISSVWVDDEEHQGCFAVCRYLGRLWRLYPVTPTSALIVDSLLDLLTIFSRPFACEKNVHVDFVREHLITYVEELDCCLTEDSYLGDLNLLSLADVMWCASIRHVVTTYGLEDDFYDEHAYPSFHAWWTVMTRCADDGAVSFPTEYHDKDV